MKVLVQIGCLGAIVLRAEIVKEVKKGGVYVFEISRRGVVLDKFYRIDEAAACRSQPDLLIRKAIRDADGRVR